MNLLKEINHVLRVKYLCLVHTLALDSHEAKTQSIRSVRLCCRLR